MMQEYRILSWYTLAMQNYYLNCIRLFYVVRTNLDIYVFISTKHTKLELCV